MRNIEDALVDWHLASGTSNASSALLIAGQALRTTKGTQVTTQAEYSVRAE